MQLISLIILANSMTASLSNFYDAGRQFTQELQATQLEDKEKLKAELIEARKGRESNLIESDIITSKTKQCGRIFNMKDEMEPSVFVFVSFSLPEATWLSLSKEVEKIGGVLVLRGLPNNSFKELATKINSLRQKGLNATVQIDPRLFSKYNVGNVPCIVATNRGSYDKLSGNVSLQFALEKIENEHAIRLGNRL